MVASGLTLAFPALGGSATFASAPGVQAFSGIAGSMFLIIAGAGLLQAERNIREHAPLDEHGETH
jgi:hypothetical protein